ncbi:class I SAM-dependent methyltransferase [Amycolatopsis sp. BJA-103]|uniref:methyltransferase n=1 Tax=unclassified Amycolatopsis TaxID=2618356 RepID=UPI000C78F2CE|nr:class I SAM-dependent methyltransferase [Amycolatopsis sp. BJA-103]AUI61818.1 methylase [Amycolatopsis sp. BJA-103]PNE20883.1 methylase [Amycolatopsis sp. BJA-103]
MNPLSIKDGGRRWLTTVGSKPPRTVVDVDDGITADEAFRLAESGTGLVWHGDYPNARNLLAAMSRRCAPAAGKPFQDQRNLQARRARLLGRLLVPLDPGHVLPLRRGPDVRTACAEVYGPSETASLVSLRELLGVVGAHEWRVKGVEIPALGAKIHPHHGVFSPVRGEYVDLVARTPLPAENLAFDIGTGTGVLAAVLARRGVERVVATDNEPRALACARENFERLGFSGLETLETDVFPPGRAPLVVCNPPWLPARAHTPLERAVYDPGSRMLHAFLDRLPRHLEPGGEAWLILSDLAELLGLRTRARLLEAFERSGLEVRGREDTRPRHPRASDPRDPLHAARAKEVTSLWRLTTRAAPAPD